MNIQLHEVKSSQITAIGYAPETETLAVQFKSKGGPGATYEYFDVPLVVYKAFDAADSIGKYFGAFVKGKYKYERVAEPPVDVKETASKVVMDTKQAWPFPKPDDQQGENRG